MSDNLYGIKKVIVTELDPANGLTKAGAIPIQIKTADTADLKAVYSNGEEKVLRADDIILAIAKTPDLLYGYTLTLKDNTFSPEVAALIEGAVIRKSGEQITGYDCPKLADGSTTLKKFKAEIYIANYEGDSIKNYAKITLNKCEGKAADMQIGKDFYAPSFEIDARENTQAGLAIKSVDYVDTLPADDLVKPVVTMTSTASVTKPAPVIAKSSKLGMLYLALAAVNASTKIQLDYAVSMGIASVVGVAATATDTNISTANLAIGTYEVYAVDTVGNVSTASTSIDLV
jgi:hypothetical protein